MGAPSEALLDDLVKQVEHIIDRAVNVGLSDAVYLLRMARLDLLMRRHGIRDAELRAINRAVQRRSEGAADGVVLRPRAERSRTRRRR
jgi:hypothetical protein